MHRSYINLVEDCIYVPSTAREGWGLMDLADP